MLKNKSILILISAQAEWQPVCARYPGANLRHSPYGDWFEAGLKLPNREELLPVVFFHQGWGKIAAAGATQYAIDHWHPDLLVNLGTCGGFQGQVQRGEIILAESTLVYDIIEQMGDSDAAIEAYTTHLDLTWLPNELPVSRIRLLSADRDLLANEIPELKTRYAGVAADWESGAISYVASRNEVPVLILRGVSDLVGEAGGEAYHKIDFFKESCQEIMRDLFKLLPQFMMWFLDQTPGKS